MLTITLKKQTLAKHFIHPMKLSTPAVTLLENHHLDQSSPRHRHHPRLLVLFGVACTQEILMYKI
jgi:hypothetical protein